MDAVTKATEALTQHMLDHAPPGQRPDPVAVEAMTRVVLAAVGYPAHESSGEGTCWCPVAEQAGRERDAAIDQRDSLHAAAAAAIRERDTLRDEADALNTRVQELQAALDQVADAFNARDAVTETDAAMYATDPGEALSRAVASILDDLTAMMEAAHCEARRAVTAEAERDRMEMERARYRMALEEIADPRCGIFTAGDGKPGIDAGAESRIARAALDAEETP